MRPIDADALLEKAVPHGWSTPLWVSDIVIEDAPTIEVPKWIPCSERLPECGIDVLTDNGYGEYEINHTIGGGWYWEPVAAWMPLPKPWKGEDDGEAD